MVELRKQLIRDEAMKLKPYKCPAGKLTIGVGRNIEDIGITEDEANYLLNNDIARVNTEVLNEFPWAATLDPIRFGVLINLGFNMGIKRLKGFKKFLASVEANDWENASKHLLDSKYATQVGDRAKRLAKQLITGEWQ